jgi:putative NIF3 family GTP cyclohydrolase 1 type 2
MTILRTCVLAVALVCIHTVLAIRGGVADDCATAETCHSFAGVVLTPDKGTGCTNYPVYWSCGAALVDLTLPPFNLPSEFSRRMVLSAAHCVIKDFGNNEFPFYVSFDSDPQEQPDPTCASIRLVASFQKASAKVFTAKNTSVWTSAMPKPSLVNPRYDFALLLLDEPVPSSVIPQQVKIRVNDHLDLAALPKITACGYGTYGWGTHETAGGGLVGQITNEIGPRERRCIVQDVLGVHKTGIVCQQNVVTSSVGICNADSGSLAFEVDSITGDVYGHGAATMVSTWCRAINEYTRVDNQNYLDWFMTVRDDIIAAVSP